MKVNKTFLVVFLAALFLLYATLGLAENHYVPVSFKDKEPDGFREFKWGTTIESFAELNLVEDCKDEKGCYKKEKEDFVIGGIHLNEVRYYFYKGKLWKVIVLLPHIENYENFRQAIFDMFGKGEQQLLIAVPLTKREYYQWRGVKSDITLIYDETVKREFRYFSMSSPKIEAEKKKDEMENRLDKVLKNIEPGDFRNTIWGISKEQVKKIEKEKMQYESDEMLGCKDRIAGLNCDIVYIFVKDQLVRAKYIITESHLNKNDYISDFNKLKELLTKKYGKPSLDSYKWKKDLYKDNYQDRGTAISVGHLVYFASWETPETEIILGLSGDNFKISLAIEYSSKKLEKLEKETREKKEMDKF